MIIVDGPAVFIDRDGVINSNKINGGYIGHIKDFKWIPGAKIAIRLLKKKGYKVVVVTNQSGIARGFFSLKDMNILHKFIQVELKKFQTKIARRLRRHQG
jgi:D-glycero-D-manno-heptose 1,7-bisphosphate phosphatase